jgi:hypothetical protein
LISGFQPDEWGNDPIRRAMPCAIGNSQGDALRYWKQGFQPLYIDGVHRHCEEARRSNPVRKFFYYYIFYFK